MFDIIILCTSFELILKNMQIQVSGLVKISLWDTLNFIDPQDIIHLPELCCGKLFLRTMHGRAFAVVMNDSEQY